MLTLFPRHLPLIRQVNLVPTQHLYMVNGIIGQSCCHTAYVHSQWEDKSILLPYSTVCSQWHNRSSLLSHRTCMLSMVKYISLYKTMGQYCCFTILYMEWTNATQQQLPGLWNKTNKTQQQPCRSCGIIFFSRVNFLC